MIVTFYSYKGGVGRSQLAAHLAAYLCYYENRRVLILDWDLEAPGIELFFFKDAGEEKRQSLKKGLMDLFINYVQLLRSDANVKEEQLPYFTEEYINTLNSTHQGGKIDLITAIKYDNDFSKRINEFDWYDFYENLEGKVYIEFLKDRLNDLPYDYIFIDSRTGVSDYSGICNIQMPQLNVMVMAATYQNIEGSLKVAQNIYKSPYIQSKKYRPNWIMPILSRLDTQDNQGVAKWVAYFRKTFTPFITDYLKAVNSDLTANESMVDTYISATRLDYKTELSYGENILFKESLIQKFEDGTIERQFFNIARMIEVLAQKDSSNSDYNHFSLNEPITFITKFKKATPKFLTYIPTVRLPFIIDRANQCQNIKKALDTEGGRVAISGIGGSGKTVLAQLYVDKYKDTYEHIAFVEIPFVTGDDTDKAQALLSAFVHNTALTSNLSFSPNPTDTLIDNFSVLMSKLESVSTQNSLLVIDNAYDIIEQYLKYFPSKWHILLTSRAIMNDSIVRIDPIFSTDEVQKLFYAYYTISEENSELEKIIQTVDGNPLAITLLAKTAQKKGETIERLAKRLGQLEITTLDNEAFLINFGDLEEPEKQILRYFSLLPTIFYSYNQLKTYFQITKKEEKLFVVSLERLVKKGLIVQDKNKKNYTCPLIMQQLIRKELGLSADNCSPLIQYFINILRIDTDKNEQVDNKKKYIEIVRSIIKYIPDDNKTVGSLANNLSVTYYGVAQYDDSLAFALLSLTIFEKTNGSPEEIAIACYNIAQSYFVLKSFEFSLSYYEKAGKIYEQIGENLNLGKIYTGIGGAYYYMGNYEKSLENYSKALYNNQKLMPKNAFHRDLAISYINVSVAYCHLNNVEKAEDYKEQALEIINKNLQEDTPLLAYIEYLNKEISKMQSQKT